MSWKGFSRFCCRTIGIILLIVLVAFLYLSIWGVPRQCVDRLLGELKSAGYVVTVERIRLNLMQGIVADQIRVFEDEYRVLPMLEVKQAALFLNPLDWLRREAGLRCLRVHDGLLRLSLADSPTADDNETLVLRYINGVLHFQSDALDLTEFSADLIGLQIKAHGVILMPSATERQRSEIRASEISDRKSAMDSPPLTRQIGAMIRSYREQILEVVQEVNAIRFGITPYADITFRIDTENITAGQAAIRLEGAGTRAFGIQLDQWQLLAEMKDGQVHLSKARLQQQDQHLACSGSYTLDSGAYKGRAESSFDPRLLAPTLGSNQAEMVNAFVFHGPPPAVEVNFSGQAKRNDALWAGGRMQSSNFTYQTVPITSFEIRFGYTNEILLVDAVRLVLSEGEVTGHFKVRLDKNIADIDVVSTANPITIARLAGPEIAAHLDRFHFTGPMRIAAQGCVDYGANALTDVKAKIDGTHCGYAPLDIERCSLKAAVNQSRLDLTDIQVELYEGTLAGKASLYPLGTATNLQYDVSARVDGINFNTLMQSLGYKGKEEYEGLIYSECVASGVIDQERGNPVSGGGWVRIQDGRLFQLHLLDDFSRILSKLYPGMGTISLTDFGANFTVKDRKINARDLVLSGPMFAIHGEGYYAFDESLDFIVWVQPPKGKSLLPELSKVTTSFLAKLLAVRLTGTIADPKWWPLNLTRDQLLTLPQDILVTMPKDVLIGLPRDLLINLPQAVLVTLPHQLLVTLPKEILVDLPQELFIKLPKDIWNMLKPLRSKKVKP